MLTRVRRIVREIRRLREISGEVAALEGRVLVLLADLWHRRMAARVEQRMTDIPKTRLLLSRDETLSVTGTQTQIESAARRMASRTKSCVVVAVVVGHYHVRGCDEHRRGGYIEEGD